MRLRAPFGVASVVAVVGMLWGTVTPAHACVPGTVETWVAQSQQIVVGRFGSWEMAGDIERPYPPGTATRHRVQVLETLKGNVGQEIIVLDRFSLFEKNGTYVWGFSPSDCPPTLEKDPTGRSAIVGVVPPDNGSFSSS